MQHQQHDWFMTTLVNCVKTKKYTFAERSEATYLLYIYILECSMVAEGPAAEGPAADSRPYTLANILLVLKTPIEVYKYNY